MSKTVLIALTVLALALGGLAYWIYSGKTTRRTQPASAELENAVRVEPSLETPETLPQATQPPLTVATNPRATLPVQPARAAAVAPEMRALVQQLSAVDFASLTSEQAALWKTNLQNLVQAGTNAVPAIREFLLQNQDARFDAKQGKNLLGFPSVRVALLDALQEIGGPAALDLAAETLRTATQPHEIAQLARHLETDAPGQHREAILGAARESLAMGSSGKLGGVDVGPLFDVLSRYGGAAAAGELQQAARPYRYYSAVALANLPDGAGIPALSGMLREPKGPNKSTHTPAVEALAQLAPYYPEAAARLVQQVHHKHIPDSLWSSIAESLAGARFMIGNLAEWGLSPQSGDKTFHLAAGNQNILKRRNVVEFSPEQRQQSIGFIDQLLALNPGPIAAEHLQKARAQLTK